MSAEEELVEQRRAKLEADVAEQLGYQLGQWLTLSHGSGELVAEHAETRTAVQDEDVLSDPNLNAGGMPAIAQVFRLRRGGLRVCNRRSPENSGDHHRDRQ